MLCLIGTFIIWQTFYPSSWFYIDLKAVLLISSFCFDVLENLSDIVHYWSGILWMWSFDLLYLIVIHSQVMLAFCLLGSPLWSAIVADLHSGTEVYVCRRIFTNGDKHHQEKTSKESTSYEGRKCGGPERLVVINWYNSG